MCVCVCKLYKNYCQNNIYINFWIVIGLMSRVFAYGPGDWGWVIPKTQKWYLMPPCFTLSIIRYGSWVKWSKWGNVVVPFPTPQCSSYWKRSLWVTLDYNCQLYLHNFSERILKYCLVHLFTWFYLSTPTISIILELTFIGYESVVY